MVTKRIIPCLDIKDGRVVKGVNFLNLQDVSNPVKLADYYSRSGADELVFYDITASFEGRKLFTDILTAVASTIFIPLTVGGGINSLEDFERVLTCGGGQGVGQLRGHQEPGAHRPGGQALRRPMRGAVRGRQAGGRQVSRVPQRRPHRHRPGRPGVDSPGGGPGRGEVVVNSIDTDGVKKGFDLEMLRDVSEIVHVPVIASGGAGGVQDFVDLFREIPDMSAGLAASIFHFGEVAIPDLKQVLRENGVCVRL